MKTENSNNKRPSLTGLTLTLVATSMFLFSGVSQAQDNDSPSFSGSTYKNAIGLRAGGTSGVTFKHFFGGSTAFEGILGIWPNAIGFTALVEKHANAFDVSGFNWYYGGGGHVTATTRRNYYYYDKHDRYRYYYRGYNDNLGLGIDGILGLEYKIIPIPFAISLDIKPFVEVTTNGNVFFAVDPGLGIKVAF